VNPIHPHAIDTYLLLLLLLLTLLLHQGSAVALRALLVHDVRYE